MKKYNLGIIGCGNMSSAIIRAITGDAVSYLLKQNGIKFDVFVSDADKAKLDAIRTAKIATFADNAELVAVSNIIILAVKPQAAAEALKGIDFSGKIVISIMAGTNLKALKALLGGSTDKIVRVMPNLNAKVCQSVNAYCCSGLNEEEEETVVNILGSFGQYFKVHESKMNAITGISGSGPAFVFMFINSFIEKAVDYGFDRQTAKEIALQTICGCAETIRYNEGSISDLVASVCSKGGTTIEGVKYLREKDFENTVKEAIMKSEKRSEELESGL